MLKVLVVDDDQGLRFSVKENLAQSGQFEIDEAFDGINAIEKVRALN
jgi:two-component system response regulator HydG